MQHFQELVADCNLLDLPYVGSVFTWWNKRGLDLIGKNMDKALINRVVKVFFLTLTLSLMWEEFQTTRDVWLL